MSTWPGNSTSRLVFVALAFTACTTGPTDAFSLRLKPGNGKGPGTTDPGGTPLSVAFRDDAGDAVQSDGLGAYVHDEQEVRALFGDYVDFPGQFQFNTDTDDTTPAGRDLHIDIPGVFTGTVIGLALAPGVFLDLANPGESRTTRLKVTWQADGFRYTLRYGAACGGADPTDDGVTVTLTSDDPRTYLVTDLSDAIVCKDVLKGKPTTEIVGPISAPLAMTIIEVDGQNP